MSVVAEKKKKEDSALKKKWRTTRLKMRRRFYYCVVFPLYYRHFAKKPINENKIVFIEVRYSEISNSLRIIYEDLKANYDYEIKTCFLRRGYVRHQRVLARALYMLREIADAAYVITYDGIDMWSRCRIRPETKIVQLWHACGAFKKFGMSTADSKFGNSRGWQKNFSAYRHLALVSVSSPEVVWAYEEAMQLGASPGIVKPLGTSRTDIFFDESYKKDARERLHAFFEGIEGKKILLYAPTYRGRVAEAEAPDRLDIEKLCDALSDEWILLIKHHPMVRNLPQIPPGCGDFAYDVTNTMTIEDLTVVSDVCITDYSSVIYEYSIFERPMIFFAYDIDDYFDWRGFYYPFDETFLPGPIVKTSEEIIGLIKNPEGFDIGRVQAFKQKFMSSCDGHATRRIIEDMTGGRCAEHRLTSPRDVIYEKDEDMRVSVTMPKDIAFSLIYAYLQKIYDKAANGAVDKKKVVILADKRRGLSVMQERIAALLSERGMKVVKDRIDSGRLAPSVLRSMVESVKEFADAGYILTEGGQSTILKKICLRTETSVVYTQEIYDRFMQPGEYVNNFYDINRERKIFCTSADVNILERTLRVGQVCGDLFFDETLQNGVYDRLKKKSSAYNPEKKNVLFIINTYEGAGIDWDAIAEGLSASCNLLVYNKNKRFEFKTDEGKRLSFINAEAILNDAEAMACADIIVSDHDLTAVLGLAAEKKIIFIGEEYDAMALVIDDPPLRAFYRDNLCGKEELAERILAGTSKKTVDTAMVLEKYFPGCDGGAARRLVWEL